MKLIIDIEKDYYEIIKYKVEHGDDYKPYSLIANGIPYEERPQGDLLQPLTELCDGYCKTCPVMGEKPDPNDCTDCIVTHIRGIINRKR